jgi:hypothetical protein
MTSPRPLRFGLLLWVPLAACLYALFALIVWRGYTGIAAANPAGVWDTTHILPQASFAMFWFSGAALLRHAAGMYGLVLAPSAWETHTLQIPLVVAAPFHVGWLYPPVMGLLSMLYATLPLAASFWVWRGLYFAISAALLRRAGLGWGAIVLGLACPAAMIDFEEGENGTLTGGLAAAALLTMERAPRMAGGLAALLSLKPQTGAALPFILLQPRLRAALGAGVVTGAVLVLATLLLIGWQSWAWFLLWSPGASSGLVATPFTANFPEAGATVFYMVRSFGQGVHTALAAQLLSSALAAVALWRLWRVPGRPAIPRMAATLALSALLVPYGYLYDLVGFSVGMAAMCLTTSPARKPVYAALWLFAGHSATVAGLTGHVLMPLTSALAAVLAYQESSSASNSATCS